MLFFDLTISHLDYTIHGLLPVGLGGEKRSPRHAYVEEPAGSHEYLRGSDALHREDFWCWKQNPRPHKSKARALALSCILSPKKWLLIQAHDCNPSVQEVEEQH